MKTIAFLDKKERIKQFHIEDVPVCDTHTHIFMETAENPVDALVEARRCNVCSIITPLDPCDEAEDADATLERMHAVYAEAEERLSEDTDEVSSSELDSTSLELGFLVGAHPYHAQKFVRDEARIWDAFKTYEQDAAFVGVGEIGLDYTCSVDKSVQRDVFEQQLAFACEHDYPVELHIRDERDDEQTSAHKDALAVLKEVGIPQAGCVLHCFTQGPDVAYPFLEQGLFVAFGGALTFTKSDEIRDALLIVPNDRILIETDAPFMAPVPLRGQTATPAMAALVAQYAAQYCSEHQKDTTPKQYLETFWRNSNFLRRRLS